MRVLIVHNHYGDYAMGGEAGSVRSEAELLRSQGHEVEVYERANAELLKRSWWGRARAFAAIPWSAEGYAAVGEVIDRFQPDIMHVNNYKYLLSPSIFAAAKEKGVTTVLTLRNYRLACPAGMFLRRGVVCEDCLDGFPYRMLWRRCVSDNMVANLSQFYLYWGTRRRKLLTPWVDAYIALTEFARDKFVMGGLPADKVHVKPNFMSDPLVHFNGETLRQERAICVGRLSHEKGIMTLLRAWRQVNYPLLLVGDGPQRVELKATAPSCAEFAGTMPHEDTMRELLRSLFLVFPSACYEGFPRTVLEAMALGKAVLASDLGGRREIMRDHETGLLFEAGNVDGLRRKALWLIEHPDECARMGQRAREVYLEKYTPEKNYQQLMSIYESALANGKQSLCESGS